MNVTEWTFFYLVGVAASVVGVLGLVGNGLSLAVLSRPELRGSNSTLYLLVLGVYDMTFLFLNLLMTSLDWFFYGIDVFPKFGLLFISPASVIVDPFIAMTISGSVYTTVALTIDRCIAVVMPLHWARICTRGRIKLVQVLVFLWSVLTTGPLFAEFKLKDRFLRSLNETYLLPKQTSYGSSHFHNEVYLAYFVPLTTFLLPSLAIFIPNVLILVSLRRMRQNNLARTQSTRSTRAGGESSSRLTAQVLFISFFTFVSRLIHGASYLITKLEDAKYVTSCSQFCGVVAAINAFILTLNPSVNFVCYCTFGVKFRKSFFDMMSALGCCERKEEKKKVKTVFPFTVETQNIQSVENCNTCE